MTWTPDLADGTPCTYCEALADCWDHVIPLDILSGPRRSYSGRYWIVPACTECNRTLGFKAILNIPERAAFLHDKYAIKYRKLLSAPEWSAEELADLGPGLRASIVSSETERASVIGRMAHLKTVSVKSSDYLQPDDYMKP